MIMVLKQKKFKPSIKLNHNIDIKVVDDDETRGINDQTSAP